MKQLEGMLEIYSVPRGETLQYKQGLYELLSNSTDYLGIPSLPSLPSLESPSLSDFTFTPSGKLIISHSILDELGLGISGDLHDTYKVDRYGNLYKGHTTIRTKGDQRLTLSELEDMDTQK